MTYSELLQSKEWSFKRQEILARDKMVCQNCKNQKHLNQFYLSSIGLSFYKEKIIITGYSYLLKQDLRHFSNELNFKDFIQLISTNKNHRTLALFSFSPENKYQNLIAFLDVPKFQNSEDIELLRNKMPFSVINDEFRIAQNKYEVEFVKACDEIEIKWLVCKNLHIHHKYYQTGKQPWEYPNEALTTLCWDCHEDLHKNEKIPHLDINGKIIGTLTPCSRCFGAGYFPEYNHVQNGVCFECSGAKYKNFI
ncbi:hypothetical protein EGI26_17880 [Lacihabitans sp. CCS-44]|uniref:hypothetical protein n=1 Tax=Lacihabitans sp. CCS-44 TaxID=2487331 RepID=UPI0020CEC16A|nr:hypothetical protein [Lacihabitans sp. CCS-44]MCP9757033.1 hypothetical protein [Lacihabitans sp. CCS-44]